MLDTSQCQKPEKRMSFRGIRASKFRHVFGSPAKKEKCFENVRITRNAHEGNYCAVNPKFLGVVVEVSHHRDSNPSPLILFFVVKT
jgi:coronin-2